MRPAMSPGVLAGVFRWANMLNVLRDKHESRRLIHAPYQVRARELCLAAGVDPDSRIERPGLRSMPAWCAYRDAARQEHLACAAQAAAEGIAAMQPQALEFQDAPLKWFGQHDEATLAQM